MGSSSIPAELTDRIIDFCHNDKRTLSNCGLTHSSWLAASRFHLFHTITTGAHGWTDREIQLKSIIYKRTFAFLHRRSSVLPYIRTVKIESYRGFDATFGLIDAVNLAHTIHRFCCLENIPDPSVHVNLTKFHLFLPASGHTLQPFTPVSDIVTHVRLLNVTFARPNAIWPFLSSFPRLQCLELEDIGFRPSTESSFPADRIFDGVPLSTVRLTTASMGFVIGCLTRVAGSLSYLHDFGIAYQDIRQEELPQLAGAIQRRVGCLRFSASCYPGDERVEEWRPSAFDTREQTSLIPCNPETNSPDVWQGSRSSLGAFVHFKLSSWIISEWMVPAATTDPTCHLNGSRECYNNFLPQFRSWCLR